MEQNRLEIKTLCKGIFSFIKKQFKQIGTWAKITFLTYLGTAILGSLVGAFIGTALLILIILVATRFNLDKYVTPELLALLEYMRSPVCILIAVLVAVLCLWIGYKLCKKMTGIANTLMLNILAATKDKALPRFSIRDERLGVYALIFCYFLMVCIGLLLLVIPGIIFLVRFSLSYMIFLDEKCSVKEAFHRSWQMTRGNFWLMLPVIALLSLSGAILPVAFNIIYLFIPINLWAYGYTYSQLKQR